MPAHKGQKKVGGRKKGTPNKATAGLKAAFQEHEEELVKGLLALTKSTDEHVSLGALKVCFDRGWGRPPAAVAGVSLVLLRSSTGNLSKL